jgi:hypothetical protein
MKTTLVTAGLAAVVLSTSAFAQTFTPASGYSASPLFSATPGFSITAFTADSVGDIYYLETDNAFTAGSVLRKRTAASGYTASVSLHTFSSPAYGSFIETTGSRLIFGADNAISAINLDGSGFDDLGSVVFNYDGVFASGALYLSASSEGFGKNKVSRFTLVADGLGGEQLSAPDVILDTVSDNSGPIEFDSTGALLYGANKSSINGIYRYSATDVAGAFGPTQLTLAPPANRIFANGQNQYFARRDDAHLFQTYSPFGGTPVANVYDLTTSASAPVGQGSAASGDYFSGAAATGDSFFIALTSGAGNTTVYRVVPEPVCGSLLVLGTAALATRRRRV